MTSARCSYGPNKEVEIVCSSPIKSGRPSRQTQRVQKRRRGNSSFGVVRLLRLLLTVQHHVTQVQMDKEIHWFNLQVWNGLSIRAREVAACKIMIMITSNTPAFLVCRHITLSAWAQQLLRTAATMAKNLQMPCGICRHLQGLFKTKDPEPILKKYSCICDARKHIGHHHHRRHRRRHHHHPHHPHHPHNPHHHYHRRHHRPHRPKTSSRGSVSSPKGFAGLCGTARRRRFMNFGRRPSIHVNRLCLNDSM